MNNNRRRLLFIAFDYHEYSRAIHDEFRRLGFESQFHSIQPGLLYLKVARRMPGSIYETMLNRYHRRIIFSYPENSIDQVVFLQVHQFSQENMELLKKRQPKARYILYNWDAVTTHDYRPYLGYFHQVWTFDPSDARALDIGYLPLFCIRRFQNIRRNVAIPLSAYFVGNIVNPERYVAVNKFYEFCCHEGIAFDSYLSTTLHGWSVMRNAGISPKNVSFRSIGNSDFLAMIERANAVFDFANHKQTGFTMRTMENLCAGKKIITNNPHAREAEFYSPDRFFVFEGMDFSGVVDFLKEPLRNPFEDFPAYHVQNFARRLLGVKA